MATPSYNFTIDDSSPMIKYEPSDAWSDKASADPTLNKYFQSSYHYTTAKEASASLTFVGTGITVIGSRSNFHGAFELRIDDQKIRGLNSFTANTTQQYRVSLASVRGLPFGNHTVKLINRSTQSALSSLDLDAFIVETSGASGSTSGNSTVVPAMTIDDAFVSAVTNKLTWSDGWVNRSKSAKSNAVFLNRTIHETTTKGSSVTLDFVGEGVQIVGAVGPNNTQYNVQLDGGGAVVMNSRASGFIPSSTLYYQTNLTPGSHKVVITNAGTDGGALTIDSFQVFGSNAAATAATTANANDGSTNNVNTSTPTGAIIGGIIAGIIVLLLLLGLGFFLWQRKRQREEKDEIDKFSIANTSYIERVRNINFTFPSLSGRRKAKNPEGLSRSASRGSEETIVDPENGAVDHTQKKSFGYGYGLGASRKWIDSIRDMVVRNPDPITPPLPVQSQQRPVVDIRTGNGPNGVSPGMVTVGLESGVPGPNAVAGYGNRGQQPHNNPAAAQVWVDGTQRIEAGRRFSDQSLEQAWDNRGNATGGYGGYGSHRRGYSSPSERPQVPWTGQRDSDGTFRVSAYQNGRGSPPASEYPETPVRPRYEVEQRHSPISSRYATNGRGQRSDFR